MKEVSSLAKELKGAFGWNQARSFLIAQFVLALIMVRTVNLVQLSQAFSGSALCASNYKRLQRFLRSFDLNYEHCSKVIARLFCPKDQWILSLDRTNWQFGKLDINFLVLGVVHQGICVPLFWTLLPKKGNSNTHERVTLLKRFLSVFPVSRVAYLTADREFKGEKWLRFLVDHGFPFHLRIVSNAQVWNKHYNRQLPVKRYFSLSVGEEMTLNKKRKVWGVSVYLSCVRSPKERVIVISSGQPEQAISCYKLRWSIETLFGCLKTRGFNLEDTHVQDLGRLNKLFFVLTLTFAWCHLVGIWLNQQKPIKLKKHGRREISIFRLGLDKIRKQLLSKSAEFCQFKCFMQFLSCT